MKRILLLLVMLGSLTLVAQTTIDLGGMTENLVLGQNCSSSRTPENFITTGDVNLNGFTLELRNVNLTVSGNLNGEGIIESCGQSQLCVNGNTQNNPTIENGLDCNTLNTPDLTIRDKFIFDPNTKIVTVYNSKFIKIYNMNGQKVLSTKEESLNFSSLSPGFYLFFSDKLKKKFLVN